jgi:hypothetical protein
VLTVLWTAAAARAGSLGLGLAFVQDLPDAADGDSALIGPGISLQVPVRIELTSNANIRVGGRLDHAGGGLQRGDGCKSLDVVSWDVGFQQGEAIRAGEYADCGWLVAGGVTVGPEVVVPVSGVFRPFLGGGLGPAAVANFHDIGRTELMGPQNDLTNPNNLDPWTLRGVLLIDAAAGLMVGDKVSGWAEVGYSTAWVGRARMHRSFEPLNVSREPYSWNALRLGAGIAFPLR